MLRPLAIATQSPTKATKKAVGLKSTLTSILPEQKPESVTRRVMRAAETEKLPKLGYVQSPGSDIVSRLKKGDEQLKRAQEVESAKRGAAVAPSIQERLTRKAEMVTQESTQIRLGEVARWAEKNPLKFDSIFGEVSVVMAPEIAERYRSGDPGTKLEIMKMYHDQAVEEAKKSGRKVNPRWKNSEAAKAYELGKILADTEAGQMAAQQGELPRNFDQRFDYQPYRPGPQDPVSQTLRDVGNVGDAILDQIDQNKQNYSAFLWLRENRPDLFEGTSNVLRGAARRTEDVLPVNPLLNFPAQFYESAADLIEPGASLGKTALGAVGVGGALYPYAKGIGTASTLLKAGSKYGPALEAGLNAATREGIIGWSMLERNVRARDLANILEGTGAFASKAEKADFIRQIQKDAKEWASKNSKDSNEFLEQQDEFYKNLIRPSLDQASVPPVVGVPPGATRGAVDALGETPFQPAVRMGAQQVDEYPSMFDTQLPSATDTRRMGALAGEIVTPEGDRYQQLIPDVVTKDGDLIPSVPSDQDFVAYVTGENVYKNLIADGVDETTARAQADKAVEFSKTGTYIPAFVEGGVNIGPDGRTVLDTQEEFYAYYMSHNAWKALVQLGVPQEVAGNVAVTLAPIFKRFATSKVPLESIKVRDLVKQLKGKLPEQFLPQMEDIIKQGIESIKEELPNVKKVADDAGESLEDDEKLLLSVAKQIEKLSRDNPLLPKGVPLSKLPDEVIVAAIRDATIREVNTWRNARIRKGIEYISFYRDDVLKANAILQQFAESRYGRKLTDNEIDFYHLVSGFASPSNAPYNDSDLGMRIFDRWMQSGQKDYSVLGSNYKTIWEKKHKGAGRWERSDTKFAKLNENGDLIPAKISPAYYSSGMSRVIRLIDNLGFDAAMDFMRTKHSFEEIVDAYKLTDSEAKAIKAHEYLSLEDGGYGVFGIGDAPKLGSYVLNRWQNFETVTKDMWVARTMARLTGQPLVVDNKVIKEPWGLTKSGVRLRGLLDQAWAEAGQALGMEPAMVQEAMWDIEQVIYNAFGNPRTASYVSEGLQRGIDVVTGVTKVPSNKEALLKGISEAPAARAFIEARPGVAGWEGGRPPAAQKAGPEFQEKLVQTLYDNLFGANKGFNSFLDKLVTAGPDGVRTRLKPRIAYGYFEGKWSPTIEIPFRNAEDGRVASSVLGKLFGNQDAVPISALSPYKKGKPALIIKAGTIDPQAMKNAMPSTVKGELTERERIGDILESAYKEVDGEKKTVSLGATYTSEGDLILINIEGADNFDDIALRIAGGDSDKVRSFMSEVGEYFDKRPRLKYNPETGKGISTGTFDEVLKDFEAKGGLTTPKGKPGSKKKFYEQVVEPIRKSYTEVQTKFGLDPTKIDERILKEADKITKYLRLEQNIEGVVRAFYELKSKTVTLLKGKADVDSLIHEVGHHLKEVLLSEKENGPIILRLYGDTNDIDGHERFANHLVAYFREGRMPNKGLAGAFASVKRWLQRTAKTYAWDEIDPEFKTILDEIYNSETQATKRLLEDLDSLGKTANDTTTTTKAAGSVAGGVRGDAGVLPAEIRGGAQAAETAREADGSLKGLPRKVGGFSYAHHAPAEEVARRYMEKTGREYVRPNTFQKVDEDRARRIAQAYEDMKHDPTNPVVKASYDALAKETMDQYDEITKEGITFEFMDPSKGDPYGNNPNNVFDDVKNNKHMWVYPTDAGYGNDLTAEQLRNNPLLADSGIKWNGKPATVNDIFRAVHDYFGHIKEGVGFRANGEENAWRAHSAMYSENARMAMTSELRGQNSWVNFGPKSDANQLANQVETMYADQKAGILPKWVMEEGRMDDAIPTKMGTEGRTGTIKEVPPGALTQTEKEPDLVATANRITEEVRKSVGLDGATKATPEQIADWTEEARKINTSKLMNDMMSGTGNLRPLSKAEELAVGARLSRALERYSAALDEFRATDTPSIELLDRIDSARGEIDEISKFSLAVGTEWGKAGIARQALIRADYTTAGVITRFRKQEKLLSKDSSMAVQATKQEMADAEEFARISREKDDKIAALEKKIEDLKAQGAKEAPKRRLELRRQKLESERDDILKQMMAIRKKGGVKQSSERGAAGINVNPKDNFEMWDLIGKLAKNHIQRGALDIEDVYVYVSEVVKQAGYNITKQGMIDALDAQMLKNRRVGAKRATKAELRARQRLYREVERGATRNVAEREREIAAREVTRKAREEAIQIKKDEIAAKREAIRAEQDAQKATSKAEADAYRAAAKKAREEARALAKQLREAERKAKLDARQARRAELTEALGPIARDERKIANLKGRIEDYNRMIESGEFFASRALKEGDEGYELTHLQTQLEQLRYEAKVAKQNVDTIIDDLGQPAWKKVFKEVIELPRYMQLGLDAGALTRQGFDIALVSPTAWTKAAKRGFGAAIANPAKVARLEEEFMRDPEVLKAIANGLAIDGPSAMPEGFISKAAQKVPGYGRGERFHKTFQNFARYETYRNLTRGQNMNQYQLKETAKLINAMTGRGGWKIAEGKLASIFTAPKMYAGQLEVMGKTATAIVDRRFRTNPAYRKLIVRRWLGRMGGIVALKALADATDWEFSINPDDSDFLKLRNGNTVIDVTGGYSSWYKLLFSTLNDLFESGMSEGFTDKLVRSLGYKVSPTVRTPLSFITGKDAIGKPFFTNPDTGEREMNVQDLAKTFAPLIGMQIYEMAGGDEGYADMDGGAKVALGGLGFIGTGVSNYEPRDPSRKPEDTKWGQFLESAGIQPR